MTKSTDMGKHDVPVQSDPGEIPSETDRLWISRIRKLSEDSLNALEEGAKSIMMACTFFITVYAFILSEAQDKSQVVTNVPLAFVAPLIFLGLSMIWAVCVLLPRRYEASANSVTRAKDTWREIANRKHSFLLIALIFLALGLLSLITLLAIYLGLSLWVALIFLALGLLLLIPLAIYLGLSLWVTLIVFMLGLLTLLAIYLGL